LDKNGLKRYLSDRASAMNTDLPLDVNDNQPSI
jgi:hypothetical protein